MHTWWISISSRKHGFLGVVILDSVSDSSVIIDLLKVEGVKDALSKGYRELETHKIDSNGQDARSFPKGRIISKPELYSKGYRSTQECSCGHVSRN